MVFSETVEHVIVVSGGPSGNETWFPHELPDVFGVVKRIGVNAVVEKGFFDYWVACDHAMFETCDPVGHPILFGHNDWHQRITAGPALDAWRAWPKIFQNDVHRLMPPPTGDVPRYPDTGAPCAQWNAFSGLAALGLAWILRPKEVDLFGFDMEGEGGAADEGHDLPRKRDAERWATEKRIFDWWMRAFGDAGVDVRRHALAGVESWPMKEVATV